MKEDNRLLFTIRHENEMFTDACHKILQRTT